MAFLDEIAGLLEASTDGLYAESSGNYWIAMATSDTGLWFGSTTADQDLCELTTGSTGFLAESSGNYVPRFTGALGPQTKVYRGHMPDSTAVSHLAVALIATPGGPHEARVDLERRGLLVLVRGQPLTSASTAYQEAQQIAMDAAEVLHGYSGSTDTATHYTGIWARSGPRFEGYDDSERPVFAGEFECQRAATS